MLRGAVQLDAALRQFVSADGKVDYAALDAEGSASACAREIAECDERMLQTREQKLAFWINAYNCLTIVGVLRRLERDPHYRGVMSSGWLGALRFFYLDRYVVCGRTLSLSTIENKILRGELREPRVHFALVCASTSCPPLKRGLYSAEQIDAELDMAARQFIQNPKHALIERETHTLWLSAIFKWYRKEFERAAGSVPNYLTRYLDDEARAYLDRHGAELKVRYFTYDWGLNSER
ncbi:MAG: DUF547 domain-containing protein [Chloroflexota bacterium]